MIMSLSSKTCEKSQKAMSIRNIFCVVGGAVVLTGAICFAGYLISNTEYVKNMEAAKANADKAYYSDLESTIKSLDPGLKALLRSIAAGELITDPIVSNIWN